MWVLVRLTRGGDPGRPFLSRPSGHESWPGTKGEAGMVVEGDPRKANLVPGVITRTSSVTF